MKTRKIGDLGLCFDRKGGKWGYTLLCDIRLMQSTPTTIFSNPSRELESLGFQSQVLAKALPLIRKGKKAYLNFNDETITIDGMILKNSRAKIKTRYLIGNSKGKKIWRTIYEKKLKIPKNKKYVTLIPIKNDSELPPLQKIDKCLEWNSRPNSFYQISKTGKKQKIKIRKPISAKLFSNPKRCKIDRPGIRLGKVKG